MLVEGLESSRAAVEKGDRMGIINIIKVVKQVHKEDVVLVKIGKFYQVYGKDAYIISCTKLLVPPNAMNQ